MGSTLASHTCTAVFASGGMAQLKNKDMLYLIAQLITIVPTT
jgi:hypothetical protein